MISLLQERYFIRLTSTSDWDMAKARKFLYF